RPGPTTSGLFRSPSSSAPSSAIAPHIEASSPSIPRGPLPRRHNSTVPLRLPHTSLSFFASNLRDVLQFERNSRPPLLYVSLLDKASLLRSDFCAARLLHRPGP